MAIFLTGSLAQAADKAFPGTTYDYALPQAFFEHCLNNGFDSRGECVWVYQDMFVKPGPLTRAAADYFTAQEIEYAEPAAWID